MKTTPLEQMRVNVTLPMADVNELDRIAEVRRTSRAALIRESVVRTIKESEA